MYEENMKSTISPTVKRAYRLIKMIQEIKCSPRQAVAQLIDNLGISKAQFYKDRNALADLGKEIQKMGSRYDVSSSRSFFTNGFKT